MATIQQPGGAVTSEETQDSMSKMQRVATDLLGSLFREDRFFLILSVFIGIFSGLAVVCFRFAIDWCRIYLLGSGAQPSAVRLIVAPTLTGWRGAAGLTRPKLRSLYTTDIFRCEPQLGNSLPRRWPSDRGNRLGRKIHRCRSGRVSRRPWEGKSAYRGSV